MIPIVTTPTYGYGFNNLTNQSLLAMPLIHMTARMDMYTLLTVCETCILYFVYHTTHRCIAILHIHLKMKHATIYCRVVQMHNISLLKEILNFHLTNNTVNSTIFFFFFLFFFVYNKVEEAKLNNLSTYTQTFA